MSEAERSLIRRASMLTVQLEMLDARFAANDGEATLAQLATYTTVTNTLRRTLEAIGLKRRQRDVSPVPDLREYLRVRGTQEAAAE